MNAVAREIAEIDRRIAELRERQKMTRSPSTWVDFTVLIDAALDRRLALMR